MRARAPSTAAQRSPQEVMIASVPPRRYKLQDGFIFGPMLPGAKMTARANAFKFVGRRAVVRRPLRGLLVVHVYVVDVRAMTNNSTPSNEASRVDARSFVDHRLDALQLFVDPRDWNVRRRRTRSSARRALDQGVNHFGNSTISTGAARTTWRYPRAPSSPSSIRTAACACRLLAGKKGPTGLWVRHRQDRRSRRQALRQRR